MAKERFAVSGSAAGFCSLYGAVENTSPGLNNHELTIPSGMISIGGNGRGFIIPETVYDFSPIGHVSDGTYVIYALATQDGSGLANLGESLLEDYITSGGDGKDRRKFIEFTVQGTELITESIRVYNSSVFEQIYKDLSKVGIFRNVSVADPDNPIHDPEYIPHNYVGQNVIENASFEINTEFGQIVYKDSGTDEFTTALSSDDFAEVVIGIADVSRYGMNVSSVYDNFVVTSGIFNVGTDILDATLYPTGTYLYLLDELRTTDLGAKSNIGREFNFWKDNTFYSLDDLIYYNGFVFKVTGVAGGQISDSVITNFDGKSVIGEYVNDNEVTWQLVANYTNSYIGERKVRIGVSLGNGVMLLSTNVSTNIDDHDESAYAHPDIQAAIKKAGIYVRNYQQGLDDFHYRGQLFDEEGYFSDVNVGEIKFVYKNGTDSNNNPRYTQAFANDNLESKVIGISYDVGDTSLGYSAGYGKVLTDGYIEGVDTSTFSLGDTIYLSEVPGEFRAWIDFKQNIPLGIVIKSGVSGVILLDIDLNYIPNLQKTNKQYVGDNILHGVTADASVLTNEIVYLASDSIFYKAKTNITQNIDEEIFGVYFSNSNGSNYVVTSGLVPFDTSGLTVGDTVYLAEDITTSQLVSQDNAKLIEKKNKIGVVVEVGVDGLLLLGGQGSGGSDEDFPENSIDSDVTFVSGDPDGGLRDVTEDFTIVYWDEDLNGYGKALANGEKESRFVGMAIPSQGIVVTGGYFDIDVAENSTFNQMITDPDADLISGDSLYIDPDGNWSTVKSVVRVGQYFKDLGLGIHRVLLAATGGGSGDGDITREDTLYMSLLSQSPFENAYYDGFNNIIDTITLGINPPTWSANNTSFVGISGDYAYQTAIIEPVWVVATEYYLEDQIRYNDWTLEVTVAGTSAADQTDPSWASISAIGDTVSDGTVVWTVVPENTKFYSFSLHREVINNEYNNLEFWYSTVKTPDFDTDVDWTQITIFDDKTKVNAGFVDLHIKIKWIGNAEIESFGVLYGFTSLSYGIEGDLFETWVADQNYTSPVTINMGNSYTNDGKHLRVWHSSGRMLTNGIDYNEIDSKTVEILFDIYQDEIITLYEFYGLVDVSENNAIRLDVEHNSDGYHILTDVGDGTKYKLQINNGNIELIEQV